MSGDARRALEKYDDVVALAAGGCLLRETLPQDATAPDGSLRDTMVWVREEADRERR